MPNIEVKLRRGTTAQHSTFTGAEGEVTVDTDKDTVIVHDGTTAGGHELRRKDDDITAADISSTDSTFSIDGSGNMGLGIAANTAAKLYIAGTGGNTFLAVKSDTMAAIDLEDNGAGTDQKHYQMVSLDGAFEIRQVNDNLTLKDTPFTVGSSGGVGIGKVNSGAYQLEIDGDILVNDTGDNFPAAVFAGSGGAAIQLNDQSTNGQVFNLSSNPEGVGGPGTFGVGSIDGNDYTAPTLTITNVTTTTTEATYTFSSAHNIKQGERVQTFGSIDANWNTTSLVLSVGSSTTLTVTKPSATTNYPTTAKRVGSFVTFSVRKDYEANVLYNFLKMYNLPRATSEPSWLENGQVWIDTTDMSLKIKDYA